MKDSVSLWVFLVFVACTFLCGYFLGRIQKQQKRRLAYKRMVAAFSRPQEEEAK